MSDEMYREDKGEVVDIGFCPVTSVQKERFSVEEANNKISISKCF
ncbi:MAG: hypothetical protein ACI4M4_08280 [Candidatus Ornithospirochaeta sp.]